MLTYEPVERYKTKDGEEFKDPTAANNHIVDTLCKVIDGKIPNDISCRSDQFKIVLALVGDIDKCKELYKALDRFII